LLSQAQADERASISQGKREDNISFENSFHGAESVALEATETEASILQEQQKHRYLYTFVLYLHFKRFF